MTRTKLVSTISRELESINHKIDWKIIKGKPYHKEARRHKMLVSMLYDLQRQQGKSRSVFSFF